VVLTSLLKHITKKTKRSLIWVIKHHVASRVVFASVKEVYFKMTKLTLLKETTNQWKTKRKWKFVNANLQFFLTVDDILLFKFVLVHVSLATGMSIQLNLIQKMMFKTSLLKSLVSLILTNITTFHQVSSFIPHLLGDLENLKNSIDLMINDNISDLLF